MIGNLQKVGCGANAEALSATMAAIRRAKRVLNFAMVAVVTYRTFLPYNKRRRSAPLTPGLMDTDNA